MFAIIYSHYCREISNKKEAIMFRKLIASCLMVFLLCGSFVVLGDLNVNAATKSKVYIGHAARDERGKYKGGAAGDQTGKEVFRTTWSYDSNKSGARNWRYLFRAKDQKKAKKMAAAMLAACKNDHIGYDQKNGDKYSCYKQAEKVNFEISKISVNCEAHCASLMSVCINAAGIDVTMKLGTPNMVEKLKATGQFEIITDKSYISKDTNLKPGDILLSGKHTAMVLDSPYPGTKAPAASSTKANTTTAKATTAKKTTAKSLKGDGSKGNYKAGYEYVLKYNTRVRTGPGTKYPILNRNKMSADAKKHALKTKTDAVLKKGTTVTCIRIKNGWMEIPSGWVATKDGKEWLLK